MKTSLNDFDEDLENEFVEETLNDLKSKLNSNEDLFGKKRSGALPEDIADEIENIFYIREHSGPITVIIDRDIDNYHLKFEILNK